MELNVRVIKPDINTLKGKLQIILFYLTPWLPKKLRNKLGGFKIEIID